MATAFLNECLVKIVVMVTISSIIAVAVILCFIPVVIIVFRISNVFDAVKFKSIHLTCPFYSNDHVNISNSNIERNK